MGATKKMQEFGLKYVIFTIRRPVETVTNNALPRNLTEYHANGERY